MSSFDKWFTAHVDDFIEGEYAKDDCRLAWNARQPEIDKLKSDKDKLFNTLEMILSENLTMRWQRAATKVIEELHNEC